MRRTKQQQDEEDELELKFDVEWNRNNTEIVGWVGNMKVISHFDENKKEYTCLLLYILSESGQWYKGMYEYMPYFYVQCEQELVRDLSLFIEQQFEKYIANVSVVDKVDLEQINHLSGKKLQYIKLSFRLIQDLLIVRRQLQKRITQNSKKIELEILIKKSTPQKDLLENIIDIREFDVPYHCRVCIDTGIRCGKWFSFKMKEKQIKEIAPFDRMSLPPLRYISFDIETTKQPLKFPDSKTDRIIMISLTHSEHSILITNKEIMKKDIQSFNYAPKQEFATEAIIYNESDERDVLVKFFQVLYDYKPLIITSFNGDKFDWPFIEERCLQNGFYMSKELGIRRSEEMAEYYGKFMIHMDCFAWVERDAYLPQGSHGLKAVTRAKLHYEPIEVDPEEMMKMAVEDGQQFAQYSISDSVATYWLYKKHIHDFILALCTIIPLQPDEVLRKGSGTLCECLLMAMAYSRNIIFPNKKIEDWERFYHGHLIDSDTYIGGKVECLRSGIYREDIEVEFTMNKECLSNMHSGVERLIRFFGYVENQEFNQDEIDRVAIQIRQQIEELQERGDHFKEKPLIYHLDVAAMYPNIILTNRLQPVAIVDNRICSGCVFNSVDNKCKRDLEWQYRVEYFPLQRNEYEFAKMQIEQEFNQKLQEQHRIQQMQNRYEEQKAQQYQQLPKQFSDLPVDQKQKLIKQRVKLITQKTYKTVHSQQTELKKATVCMRENDFYVQSVRDFRDRRYEFKELVKVYKRKADEAKQNKENTKPLLDMCALYDSLQLAHKIILNSFYGYVMRKGARWYSMPMAGIVTHVGSSIISSAKNFVDKIGLPLELDTDGIWCLLPKGFPEDFTIKNTMGKTCKFSYPCFILNELVHEKYKNPQYQWLKDEKTLDYGLRSEMSIFFEVDGPYRGMVIPAAREENKQLKKRYVVFNKNGSIAEIKGFEIKRRGELNIIKQFQQSLFSEFLAGNNLFECYQACARVAQKFLNILKSGGEGISDTELLDYILESRVLSKDITAYESQKGVAITAGKRMAEYLGSDQMKGSGINCYYIISKLPHNTPVNERSIPIMLFEGQSEIRRKYLRKWLKDGQLKDEDLTLQKIVDWNYYIERLSNTIQKLIVIPATLQQVGNPIGDVNPPEWLKKRIREQVSGLQQMKIKNYFQACNKAFAQIRHMEIEQKRQEDKQEIGNNRYDMETDFKNYLKEQQKIWTYKFKNSEKVHKNINTMNLKNLFTFRQMSNIKSVWQVLQIYEKKPGEFILWYILENGVLLKDTITIPRKLYVNSYVKEKNRANIKKILPRDKKLHYLYEFTMNEQTYQEEYKGFSDFMANPNIEGIYEQNMPLMFRFITEIGSMCKLTRECQESKRTQYTLADLQPVYNLPSGQLYLQNLHIQHIYLIQHTQLKDNVGIWFCIHPEELLIILVRKGMEGNNFEYVKQLNEQINSQRKNIKLPDKKNTIILVMNNDTSAIQHLQVHFESKINTQNIKLCVFQSSFDTTFLKTRGLNFLFTEIPTLILPKTTYTSDKLEYQWDFNLIKQSIEFYSTFPQLIEDYLQNSRYASIPICNTASSQLGVKDTFQTDAQQLQFYTDVLYQRALSTLFNGVSWYQVFMRDNRDLIPTDFTQTEINNIGIYMNYCVEINVLHYFINTIDISDELKNLDKETSALIGQSKIVDEFDNLDELVGAKLAFKILKTLVQGWLTDLHQNQDPIADKHLQNIGCWIYSGQSPLYDPYLGKMLQRLNFKIFNILAQKIMSLGAKIIHFSLTKLIICTGHQTYERAQSYVNYVLDTLKADLLYKDIYFDPSKYYTTLIYKDKYNYLGYVDYQQQEYQLEYKLDLFDCLPQKLYNFSYRMLIEILLQVDKFKQNQINQSKNLSTNMQIMQLSTLEDDSIKYLIKYIDEVIQFKIYNSIEIYDKDFKDEKFNYEAYLEQQKVVTEMDIQPTQKKKKIIEDEDDYVDQESYEQDSFVVDDNQIEDEGQQQIDVLENEDQNLPVDEAFKQNWILNKIGLVDSSDTILKMLTYLVEILSVNQEVKIIMDKVKSNGCKLLKVSDFSSGARFTQPCLEILIQNITCDNCFVVQDLDVFRQEWECSFCFTVYSIQDVEIKICQYLEQQLLFYQIQDLYCKKCKQVQDYQAQDRCQCSGQYQMKLDQFKPCFIKQQQQLLFNLQRLAQERNLQGLATLVSTINV